MRFCPLNMARHIGTAVRSLAPTFGELIESLEIVAGGARRNS